MTNSHKHTPYKLYALHGFLGLPTDWKPFDLITDPLEFMHEELDFWNWARYFNSTVKKEEKNILLGYSLGGRLAMHALISSPELWSGAIFISAHPGLDSDKERNARLLSDRQWAERFLKDPWEPLIADWNSLPVFGKNPFPFMRRETDFDRHRLSLQLTNWSLGNQEALLHRLKKISVPMMVLAGQIDTKFCTIADSFKNFSKVSIISGAAHRVPWDKPEEFVKQINLFIEEIL
jgi:2-succinyl-6-hydroxy-2,4-cyclohexadiene-1-carboxylate synthase